VEIDERPYRSTSVSEFLAGRKLRRSAFRHFGRCEAGLITGAWAQPTKQSGSWRPVSVAQGDGRFSDDQGRLLGADADRVGQDGGGGRRPLVPPGAVSTTRGSK